MSENGPNRNSAGDRPVIGLPRSPRIGAIDPGVEPGLSACWREIAVRPRLRQASQPYEAGHGAGGLRRVTQASPFIFQFAFHCIPVIKLISSTRSLQAS